MYEFRIVYHQSFFILPNFDFKVVLITKEEKINRMSHMCLMNSAAGAKKKIILDNLLKLELFYCGIRKREREKKL